MTCRPSTDLLEGSHGRGRSVEALIPCATLGTHRTEAIRTPHSLHDCLSSWGGWGRWQSAVYLEGCLMWPSEVQSGWKGNSFPRGPWVQRENSQMTPS